jgi:hypothetical protein
MALPTTTPSAIRDTSRACSGREMPKPTQTGSGVTLRSRSIVSLSSGGSVSRTPVTPRRLIK